MDITDTELKLKDAATQMRLALQNPLDESIFRSCINAFISAGRSVTLVLQKESGGSPELREWYRTKSDLLKEDPVFRFFNKKRVHTIHHGVVRPLARRFPVSQQKSRIKDLTDRGQVTEFEFLVNSRERPASPGDVLHLSPNGEATVWVFEDVGSFLPGDSGNVLRLCESYFLALKRLVAEWLQERRGSGLEAAPADAQRSALGAVVPPLASSPSTAPTVHLTFDCGECGRRTIMQADLGERRDLFVGAICFPADNVFACPGCTRRLDLTALRKSIEKTAGRPVVI